jgi:hypothetical protein
VRLLLRSAIANNVGTTASSFVPASELNGGSSDLLLDGGDREGPDCFFLSFREALSTLPGRVWFFPFLIGSFVTLCTSTGWI